MKRTRKVLNLPLIKSDGDNKLLEGHAPCLCDAPQKFEVLAAQLEPLMLPAAVYPPPGNATMRTSTHPAPHPTPSFLWLFFLYSSYYPLPTPFHLHHYLQVVAAAPRTAAIAGWNSSSWGLASETWQDIGNAQGCLLHALS